MARTICLDDDAAVEVQHVRHDAEASKKYFIAAIECTQWFKEPLKQYRSRGRPGNRRQVLHY